MMNSRRSTALSESSFEGCFSDGSVIRELCKERARKAKKRNEALFFHRIARDKRYGRVVVDPKHGAEEIYFLFPPTKSWHRYRPQRRNGQTSVDLNSKALFHAVKALRAQTPNASWVSRLNKVVEG